MGELITFSLLIITRNLENIKNHDGFKHINNNQVDFEVIVAEGDNPSMQRNKLALIARGEYLIFLDDDSYPDNDLLQMYSSTLKKYPEAVVIGGPSILNIKNNILSYSSCFFFSSFIGIGPVLNRYNSNGETRKASERDLILCNLLFNKSFFLKSNKFDRNIYPGEENKLINSLENAYMLYEPKALVHRNPRETLRDFIHQMLSYGMGRSKHLTIKKVDDLIFLIPFFFLSYIAILILCMKMNFFNLFPIVIYCTLIYIEYFKSQFKKWLLVIVLPFFFLIGHISYGIGVAFGFLRYRFNFLPQGINNKPKEIKIFQIKYFK